MAIIRKNFMKYLRMDLACNNDFFRPIFNYVYFKDGYAYASDSHILVKNKLKECSSFAEEEIERLNGKFISSKAYKAILAFYTVNITETGFECFMDEQQRVIYPFCEPGVKYPNFDSVIEHKVQESNEGITQISIDPYLLLRLKKSMFNFEKSYMRLSKDKYCFVVRGNESESIGLIMLKRID